MKYTSLFAAALLVAAFSNVCVAQEYTSVADVQKNEMDGRDFGIQGEYLWKAGEKAFAVQVIADGDGKFTLVGFPGGFPGEGWLDGQYRIVFKGEVKGDFVEFKAAYMENKEDYKKQLPIPEKRKDAVARLDIKAKKLIFPTPGMPDRIAEPVDRKSVTLGRACPEGGVLLYDGMAPDKTNTDKIARFRKINEETGAMFSEFTTKAIDSQKKYYLHCEFMLSFMPRAKSQGRSNSGVYLSECYESQVLDSFGLRGENNECGGFYQQTRPLFNACYSPLKWQTYDFILTPAKYDADGKKIANARITSALNGIVIHNDIELSGQTPGCKPEANEPRGIYFQGHGNNVQFRNIWVQYLD
ncbi:MAG: DUF1080 domain-containing protein [Planctomycetia bacterium]|nr:DUF1080 domain-containing protein [Planctomycetia bacterium]